MDSIDSMYRFLVAICPSEGSEMGCLANARDAHTGFAHTRKSHSLLQEII